jgi:methionyl-tRNA formyltransferase
MGTAELATDSLRALAGTPWIRVPVVVTQPDRPRGRGMRCLPTPVKSAAEALGLPVWQPEKARDPEFIERLAALGPDLIVVAAYGQILPERLLRVPPHGCLNVHTSLLPRYRGAAPIQRALWDGAKETGVTIMKMDAGLDTGDIVAKERLTIRDEDNAGTLHDRLAALGASLLVPTIEGYLGGTLRPTPQPAEGASYARKIAKEDGHVNWSLAAATIWNRIRAVTPRPGAYALLPKDGGSMRIKLWETTVDTSRTGRPGVVLEASRDGFWIGCGEASLRLTRMQAEGGRPLDAAAFLAGHSVACGTTLS